MFEHDDDDPTLRRLTAEERAVLDATELIAATLGRTGMAKSELARRLGVGPAEVTHRLRGRNLTVKSLAATLDALDHDLVLDAKPRRFARMRLSPGVAWSGKVTHSAVPIKAVSSYAVRPVSAAGAAPGRVAV